MFQAGESPESFSGGVLFHLSDPADQQTCQLCITADSLAEANGGDPVLAPEPVPALVLGWVEGGGGPTPRPHPPVGAISITQKKEIIKFVKNFAADFLNNVVITREFAKKLWIRKLNFKLSCQILNFF